MAQKHIYRGLFFLLLSFFSHRGISIASPQEAKASLSGYVVDAESKETLISATVTLKDTRLGAYTNKSGFFSVKNINPGKQTVRVSYLGYELYERELNFGSGESKSIRIELKASAKTTGEVSVEADRQDDKREISISRVNIPIEQLSKMRIGGEADIFRSLQMLPGVLTSSQISSGLFIRGGSPDQNLVLLDGMTVYNPSHLFGFISAFNSDAIKDVDLIKGGFPAEFGGRLSAVLNITQKNGNQDHVAGNAALGVISSRMMLEGPAPWSGGSWFISGRRTYLDLILALVPDDPENPFPDFGFYDVNAKFSQILSPQDQLSFSGFLSSDDLGLENPAANLMMGLGNRAGSLRWTHVFNDDIFSSLNVSATRYNTGIKGAQTGATFEIANSIVDYSVKGNMDWFATEDLTVKGGFESNRYIFNYFSKFGSEETSGNQSNVNQASSTNLEVNDYTHSLFTQLNYQATDRISLQAGLRGTYLNLADRFFLDPRLAVRYQVHEDIAVKASWGIFSQYLKLASAPDFSFFDTWMPTDSSVPPSRAYHYILSVETTPFTGYGLNFDLYYKKLDNISEFNNTVTRSRTVSDIFFTGRGQAYGAEVFLQKKAGDFTGWFGYALGFVEAQFAEINFGEKFRPKYDRRHDLKLVLQYRINEKWELGSSFTFQSGQSYTMPTSRARLGEDPGRLINLPSQRYGLRLPPSHQLNINAIYHSTLFGLETNYLIDIYNVYSRRDIWFRTFNPRDDIETYTDVRLLPIIPTVSIEVKF